MRAFCSVLALSLTLASADAFAQADPDAMMAQMQASQSAAQAAAVRPGDDQLSCDQMQTEMTATMSDPAVQARIAQMGAWAQAQQAQMDQARAHSGSQVATNMAMGVASSFVPWLGYAQMAAQQAQMHQQMQQARAQQAQATEMMGGMETIMPQMMRGQRLYELAQGKQCAFLQRGAPAQ